jgi:hypothetical protein
LRRREQLMASSGDPSGSGSGAARQTDLLRRRFQLAEFA